ncbi:hypothetical protein V8036_004475 [Vibrio parahaemolyticus]
MKTIINAALVGLVVLSGVAEAETELKQCRDVSATGHWKELEAASAKLDEILSSKEASTAEIQVGYDEWSQVLITSAKKLDKAYDAGGGISLEGLTRQYFSTYGDGGFEIGDYPQFFYESTDSSNEKNALFVLATSKGYGGDQFSGEFTLTKSSITVCQKYVKCQGRETAQFIPCDMWAEDFSRATSQHFDTLRKRRAVLSAKKDVASRKEWERYFEEARFQYPWEQSLTAWAVRDKFKGNELPPPPTHQYFFGHIGIAMEYVGDADDGSQFKVAPTVEWVGFNSWDSCTIFGIELFRLPCGASVVSTWTDRAGVSDVGHGAMLHLDNNYSLGATWRSDGDVGFFVTLDLLKALEDKQNSIKVWQGKVEEYF